MNLEALLEAFGIKAAQGLGDKLKALIAAAPDLAGVLQPFVDALAADVSPDQIISSLETIYPEAAQFLKTWTLTPKQHPDSLI